MTQPDTRTPRGFRDRVILEVLYSTALRREEIANLLVTDVDTDGGYVFVREGKGSKDRVTPLGQSVCYLVKSYLAGVRAEWVNAAKDHGAPIRQLQEMLGHASLGTTQLYTRVTPSTTCMRCTPDFIRENRVRMARNDALRGVSIVIHYDVSKPKLPVVGSAR